MESLPLVVASASEQEQEHDFQEFLENLIRTDQSIVTYLMKYTPTTDQLVTWFKKNFRSTLRTFLKQTNHPTIAIAWKSVIDTLTTVVYESGGPWESAQMSASEYTIQQQLEEELIGKISCIPPLDVVPDEDKDEYHNIVEELQKRQDLWQHIAFDNTSSRGKWPVKRVQSIINLIHMALSDDPGETYLQFKENNKKRTQLCRDILTENAHTLIKDHKLQDVWLPYPKDMQSRWKDHFNGDHHAFMDFHILIQQARKKMLLMPGVLSCIKRRTPPSKEAIQHNLDALRQFINT
jgi:hypothetical protein